MGLFDRLKRRPPAPLVWRVYRDGADIVAEDGRGKTYRVPLAGARSVRIVPPGGHPQGQVGRGGYQVAIACADGDAPIGSPTEDWRPARELARQLCEAAELRLDELTERMFSRVGTVN